MEAHTRIPNWMLDWVLPRLKPAEAACLIYVARRTIGFADPKDPRRRKCWDRIAISQFTGGVCSGEDPLDLGCGYSRRSVIGALGRLQELGLVQVSYQCPVERREDGERSGCGWSGAGDQTDERTGAASCPRCSRTLHRLFCLCKPTGQQMLSFLKATDPESREWYLCKRTGLYTTSPPAAPLPSESLPGELWEPELVGQLIEQAARASGKGEVGEGRKVEGFYRPAIKLQAELASPEALRFALEQTLKAGICRRPDTRAWPAYARKCGQGYLHKKTKAQAGSSADTAEEVLEICRQLNRQGSLVEARARLEELICDRAQIERLARGAGLEPEDASRRMIDAYRRGLTDWVCVDEYTAPDRYQFDSAP